MSWILELHNIYIYIYIPLIHHTASNLRQKLAPNLNPRISKSSRKFQPGSGIAENQETQPQRGSRIGPGGYHLAIVCPHHEARNLCEMYELGMFSRDSYMFR